MDIPSIKLMELLYTKRRYLSKLRNCEQGTKNYDQRTENYKMRTETYEQRTANKEL